MMNNEGIVCHMDDTSVLGNDQEEHNQHLMKFYR